MGLVLVTGDDLLVSAPEFNPFPTRQEEVTCVWKEEDVSTALVCAGGLGGSISLSTTGGSSWLELNGPAMGTPVIRIVRSRFNTNELHVLTTQGYYLSLDNGGGWAKLLAATATEEFYDMTLSHTRNVIGTSLGVRQIPSGALFTGLNNACPNIIAVAPDVVYNAFYCYSASGQCYYQVTNGSYAFVAGAMLPAPAQAQVRGLWRRGVIPGILYIANGTNGAWKSIDGFKSSSGFLQLRKPGIAGAGAGPWTQIGSSGIISV